MSKIGDYFIKPLDTSKINTAISTSKINIVTEKHLKVGQSAKVIISQKF
jgi:hypothetical protein